MSAVASLPFESVWVIDFEFNAPPGDTPKLICVVGYELKTGRKIRLFGTDLTARKVPPFDIDKTSLVVTYYGSAEMGCFQELGWPMPVHHLDLYAEYRCCTNGLDLTCGSRGLLGALTTFGLPAIDAAEKDEMRMLAMRGAPYTESERQQLLDYCESDVVGLALLLEAMTPRIDLPRALLRGRFMKAAACMERNGVPIDVDMHRRLVSQWDAIKAILVQSINREYGVFEGLSFKAHLWAQYLQDHGIPWPRLASGNLALDDDTFRDMARTYPEIAPMRELRHALSDMRMNALEVGPDGRNRTLLSAFGARSSRNTPSTTKSIWGPSVWQRGLIKPPPGKALAYCDWSQQEFGIAGALSRDQAMMNAYASGDPYLTFGKQAGRIPPDGTKESHKTERELFKICALAVQYGMEADSLAARLGVPRVMAADLLRLHRATYSRFWAWVDGAVDYAMLHGSLHTTLGWTVHRGSNPNPRSLRNFLMQGNGAEMLRLACCYATESGIKVCAPVHDALLIEADAEQIDEAAAATQAAMAKASAVVLSGFELRTDVTVVAYPDRYADPRGERMWTEVQRLLQ